MYCYKCGLQIDEKATECEHCGAFTAHVMRPKFYKTSIVFAALLLFVPYLEFVVNIISPIVPYYLIIFGVIGLALAIVSRRKKAIVINILAVVLWIMLVITPYFAERNEDYILDSDFSESVYAEYAEKNRERVEGKHW